MNSHLKLLFVALVIVAETKASEFLLPSNVQKPTNRQTTPQHNYYDSDHRVLAEQVIPGFPSRSNPTTTTSQRQQSTAGYVYTSPKPVPTYLPPQGTTCPPAIRQPCPVVTCPPIIRQTCPTQKPTTCPPQRSCPTPILPPPCPTPRVCPASPPCPPQRPCPSCPPPRICPQIPPPPPCPSQRTCPQVTPPPPCPSQRTCPQVTPPPPCPPRQPCPSCPSCPPRQPCPSCPSCPPRQPCPSCPSCPSCPPPATYLPPVCEPKIVTKEVIKKVEVPVDRIVEVEKIVYVDKPVDRIVEKEVIKTVEVPVDRFVEKEKIVYVDRPVDRIVEKEVIKTVPVEKIVYQDKIIPCTQEEVSGGYSGGGGYSYNAPSQQLQYPSTNDYQDHSADASNVNEQQASWTSWNPLKAVYRGARSLVSSN